MDEQKACWRRVRTKGQLRYALLYGGLVWGVPVGLLFVVGDFIVSLIENHFTFSFMSGDLFGRYIFEMVFFYISGWILGLLMWNRYEREYSKSVERDGFETAATQHVVRPELR
jgi:uncharacterized membrane protein